MPNVLLHGHTRTCWLWVLCVALLSSAMAQARHKTDQVKGEVSAPRLFAEGTISTPEDEIGGTFSPDGSEFYFTRLVQYTTLPRLGIICVSYLRDGHWSTGEVLPFSGKYMDYPPKFSGDGKRLLFASTRPLSDGTRGHVRIWEVERTATGWGDPRPLPPPVNAPESVWNADPSESSDGTLYFSSDRGSPDTIHIFRSRLVDGKYTEPEKLGPEINSEFNDYQPFVSRDGNLLIFASAGQGSPPFKHRPEELSSGGKPYPRSDLYVSVNRGGKWTPARHLEHASTPLLKRSFHF